MISILKVDANCRASSSGKTASTSNSNLNWCKGYVAGRPIGQLELYRGRYNT